MVSAEPPVLTYRQARLHVELVTRPKAGLVRLPPASHLSCAGWLAARRRLRYQRTASTPPVTANAIPSASRSPFQAAFSNARPPKYPRSDAYRAQMSAAMASKMGAAPLE